MIATISRGEVYESINLTDAQQANKVLAYAKSIVHEDHKRDIKKQKALIEIRKAFSDLNYYLD